MSQAARRQVSALTLVATVHSISPPVKFDAAFIERRMEEHRQQMAEYAAELASDIVVEVAAAIDQARRAAERKRLAS